MALARARVLTFFDPGDKYEWYDNRFDKRIFIRCIDSHHCRNHICDHIKQDLDVHFFFPDTQLALIMGWQPEYIDTYKYIYCRDQTSINEIKQTYRKRFAQQIFLADELEFQIGHVQVALLHSLAKNMPEESPQRDEIASKAIEQLECLKHMLKQLKTDQLSEEPVELH
ncbi:unnamed protein product [Rotaria sp. Silwood1]|nr:unnamed protein product [Rotaria sp. Silwood1]CAF1555402.1 unnamed protein product [Rotaria sp. Silwood1]CAF3573827.1 unnamed protein product [Rotaria sp. Silwood1]CAF3670933.1 unnamed protein product [Rotaria sp. Silwood1]CAF3687241.1 unnamed protein product [Rotaria sp. Silwood1]